MMLGINSDVIVAPAKKKIVRAQNLRLWEAKNCPTEGQFCDKVRKQRSEEMWCIYLLELLDGTLVDSTALVDQVACMIM
jgi:hypothetical protein